MDDMKRPDKMDIINPKSKTPEEKLEEILTAIGKKDAAIEKLEKDAKTVITKANADIEKLTTELNAKLASLSAAKHKLTTEIESSDKLQVGANDKLLDTERAAKITKLDSIEIEIKKLTDETAKDTLKSISEIIANKAKTLEEETKQVRVLRNEREYLNQQYEYENGTRFEYSSNIDEKRSTVSVSLYGIIQQNGRIIENKEFAKSEPKKYKKYKNGESGTDDLPSTKTKLKDQLIIDNIDLIRSRYNVWIKPNEVTERTAETQLPKFVIKKAAEKEKEITGRIPGKFQTVAGVLIYTATAEEKGTIEEIGKTEKPNGTINYNKSPDYKNILLDKDQEGKPNKFLNKQELKEAAKENESTGNSINNNNKTDNKYNNLNNGNANNNYLNNSEVTFNDITRGLNRYTVLSQIRQKTHLENQLAKAKNKDILTKNINKLTTEINTSLQTYNTRYPDNQISDDDIVKEQKAATNNISPGSVIKSDNNSNNTSSGYIKKATDYIDLNYKTPYQQINPEESIYYKRNEEPLSSLNQIGAGSVSAAAGSTIATGPNETDAALNMTSFYENGNGNNTETNSEYNNNYNSNPSTNIEKNNIVNNETSKQILINPLQQTIEQIGASSNLTTNILKNGFEKNSTNNNLQYQQAAGTNKSTSNTYVNNTNNTKQQLTGSQDSSTEKSVDYSQHFTQMTNILTAINTSNNHLTELLSNKLRVSVVPS